jgi:hypothetical protein
MSNRFEGARYIIAGACNPSAIAQGAAGYLPYSQSQVSAWSWS